MANVLALQQRQVVEGGAHERQRVGRSLTVAVLEEALPPRRTKPNCARMQASGETCDAT